MSQLIQLKQRIGAVETIRKITNAMRITAMSTHAKMSHQIAFLKNYEQELKNIYNIVEKACKKINSAEQVDEHIKKHLIVIIGSDKGLCGSFNSALINFFRSELSHLSLENLKLFIIGKKIADSLKENHILCDFLIDHFNYNKLNDIADQLYSTIEQSEYTNVIFIYTQSKTFFIQRPIQYTLIPAQEIKTMEQEIDIEHYIWQEKPEDLLKSIKEEFLRFSIKQILFESLYSEQSARFKSMDSATRNAETILEDMKIIYSKLRQAKITKELTELSSHFD